MIDWQQYDEDSEADWARLANQVILTAQVAVQARDDAKMGESADDIIEFAGKPSFSKPDWTMQALRRTQAQLASARQLLAIGKLEQGNDAMDGILARMSSASAELKAEAARLSLKPVKEALNLALEVTNEVKALGTDVNKLTKDDIAGKLSRLLKSVEKLRGKLGEALE